MPKQHADISLPLQGRGKHIHQQMSKNLKILNTDVCLCRCYSKFNLTFQNTQKLKENVSSMHKVVAVLFYNLLLIVSFQRCLILTFLWHIAQYKIIVMDMLLLSMGVNYKFNGQYIWHKRSSIGVWFGADCSAWFSKY